MFEVHARYSMYQGFISFYCHGRLAHGYTTFCLSIYELTDIGVASIRLTIVNNAAVNICMHVFLWMNVFIFLE